MSTKSSLSFRFPHQNPVCILPLTQTWRSSLILSSHLRLRLPSLLFPSGFPTKTLYVSFLSHNRVTHPAHLILHLMSRIAFGQHLKSLISSLCKTVGTVTPSPAGTNTFLGTLFWNTPGITITRQLTVHIFKHYSLIDYRLKRPNCVANVSFTCVSLDTVTRWLRNI